MTLLPFNYAPFHSATPSCTLLHPATCQVSPVTPCFDVADQPQHPSPFPHSTIPFPVHPPIHVPIILYYVWPYHVILLGMSLFFLFFEWEELNITQIFLLYFVFLVFYLLSTYDNTKCMMFLPSGVYEIPLFVCELPLLVYTFLVYKLPQLQNELPLLVYNLLVYKLPKFINEMLLYELPYHCWWKKCCYMKYHFWY